MENISSIAALCGVLGLLLWGLYLRRVKLTTKTMCVISVMLALSAVLHMIRLYHFPQGGSVTLGSMVPLLLVSYRYGAGVGALAGFMYGIINLLQDPFIMHPVQVLFDYPLPFMAMGLAGLLKDRAILGAAAAFLGRFCCHFVSGVAFFAAYAPPDMSPVWYSIVVNSALIVPECAICCIILHFLPIKRLKAAMG